MAERAADVLARMLELMALASRPGGVGIDDAADRLDLSRERLLDDLRLVVVREDYHPAGWTEDIRIEIGGETIEVSSGGRFDRPPGLNRLEALALAVALRTAAHDRPAGERMEMLELATRLDDNLSSVSRGELWPRIRMEDGNDQEGLRGLLEGAIADFGKCRIRYLRSDELQPSDRTIDPYCLVFGSGKWFVIGYCDRREGIRVFRLDRILEISITGETFELPPELELDGFIDGGRVFSAAQTVPVTVRYAPRIEAWIREKGPVRDAGDGGGVLVDFEIADPSWIVRHVLQYGPDAELLEPEDLRELVVESLRRQVD
jgi:predicted DNA-binding transcriptional regulator YafY